MEPDAGVHNHAFYTVLTHQDAALRIIGIIAGMNADALKIGDTQQQRQPHLKTRRLTDHHRISALRYRRRRKIQFVYQNPFASLDPRQTLFAIIEEPLKNFERLSAATRRQRVESVAARVALAPELLSRTPRELSGGQRQRAKLWNGVTRLHY